MGFLGIGVSAFPSRLECVEGGVWLAWFGHSVNQLVRAIYKKQHTPEEVEAQKVEKVFKANKKLALSANSAVSALSMVSSWMHRVKILTFTYAVVGLNFLGYTAGTFNSIAKLKDAITEVCEAFKNKSNFAKIDAVVKVAFFSSMVAWSFLGTLFTLHGKVALLSLMDMLLLPVVLLFLASFILSLLAPQKAS